MFIESIKYYQGKLWNPDYHQARFEQTRKVFFPDSPPIILADEIHLPRLPKEQIYKCRIVYAEKIQDIAFIPYALKSIQTLQIVSDPQVDYTYKYLDRKKLDELYAQKQTADDILIVKNGRITDTSYANVALLRKNQWFTPTFPLLKGTQRAYLLDRKIITEADIFLDELPQFESVRIFNALLDWDSAPTVAISGLLWLSI